MIIALAGNPNAGKSSIFNHLTGLKQKTGNFPGVTVDKKTGSLLLPDGTTATVTDLPGAYSLYPNSMDEMVVADTLCNQLSPSHPDLVIYIADVNNLERHLLLCSQIIDLQIPVVVALTMTDIAEKNGLHVHLPELENALGIKIIPVNGRSGKGIDRLIAALPGIQPIRRQFIPLGKFCPAAIASTGKITSAQNDYIALLAAHHYQRFTFITPEQKNRIAQSNKEHGFISIQLQVQETLARYDKITALLKGVVVAKKPEQEKSFTEKLDRLLTHKVFGSLIFLTILFLLFQAVFAWAAYPMNWIDAQFAHLADFVKHQLPGGLFNNLVSEGIIPGLAGIFIFIPQIAILFAVIVFLEDVGYMSRAIFLSDNLMRQFGLNGRSIVSLFSGMACAVPAIMATRTITNWKERLTTIMVTPLISCSARIPVFTILIALVVPADAHIGIFNTQGVMMMGLYVLGASSALAAAFVLRKVIKTSEHSFLVMELPSYKSPHWKNIVMTVWEKVKIFVTQAGKVIMIISIVLWFLSSYGPASKMEAAEQTVIAESNSLTTAQLENKIAARKLESSYAGHLGRLIEPVLQPLGFDWKIGIAILTSFAAREVFVGTIATLYSMGSSNGNETVLRKLQQEVNEDTGQLMFSPPVAMSLLIFYVFAMQCMSTLAVVKRETKSWKWVLVQFGYMTALAYLGSLVTFQVMR